MTRLRAPDTVLLMQESQKPSKARSAWEEAQAYGIDMSLLESNLRKTPQERIRAHSRALAMATALKQAMKQRHARS